MERCLEDLFIRMIYLMTCRKGLPIYPLLLFVVVTNKEQSHHRITGAGCRVLDKGLAVCSHPTKTVRNEQYNQLLEVIKGNKLLHCVEVHKVVATGVVVVIVIGNCSE
jgi:hypothetical protein